MKFGPVTKVDKKNKATSKKKQTKNDVMLPNCYVIGIFPIYGQFGAIQKPNSRCIASKTMFSLTVTFYLTKTENRTEKYQKKLSYYCFE